MLALLLVGAVFSLWSARLGVPYPALLALTGAALALMPGVPELTLDPELALALFVAPALLDVAYDASPRDLRGHRNRNDRYVDGADRQADHRG